MNSMTGYGFKEVILENSQVSVEIKSVNSRFLDLNIYMPPFLNPIESTIRQLITEKVVRGKIDLTIRYRDQSDSSVIYVDPKAVEKYYRALKDVVSALEKAKKNAGDESKDESLYKTSLEFFAKQDGVLNVTHEYDAEGLWENKIKPVFEEVFQQYLKDRQREGENLKKDLFEKLDVLDECAAFFKQWQPQMEEKFRVLIYTRFEDLLGDRVDENRIMQETAAMLVKYTINEEIVRLQSHLKALRAELENNPVPGKRIDFICQEANREINTIGSKNQFIEVGEKVITAKDALENIREQAKNIE